MEKIRLVHLITGLNGGGAENMLYKVLKNSNQNKFEIEVISMTDKGVYGEKIENELGIKVHTLNLSRGKVTLQSFLKCLRLCENKDILQSWMYHANLLGFFVSKIKKIKIVWGIHHSDLSPKNNKKSTIYIAKFSALLSKNINKIVSCGEVVKKTHVEVGYSEENHIVIPNGFETDIYYSKLIENEISDKKIILHVARWNPLKDYENLLNAIKILRNMRDDFEVWLVGSEIDNSNDNLVGMIENLNIGSYLKLLGRRNDIPDLMRNATVFVSSSKGEGFPNVLGEALCCGTLCVTTDAGDSSYIVQNYGVVVPVMDCYKLAQGINEVLSLEAEEYLKLSEEGVNWISNNFEINKIVAKYEDIYESLMS